MKNIYYFNIQMLIIFSFREMQETPFWIIYSEYSIKMEMGSCHMQSSRNCSRSETILEKKF